MISKKDIIEFAKTVTRRTQGLQDRRALHPRRDWFIGLLVCVIIVAAGGFVSVQRYVFYDEIEASVTPSVPPVQEYNATAVNAAIRHYQDKQERFDTIRNVRPVAATSTEIASSSVAEVVPEDSEADITPENLSSE